MFLNPEILYFSELPLVYPSLAGGGRWAYFVHGMEQCPWVSVSMGALQSMTPPESQIVQGLSVDTP